MTGVPNCCSMEWQWIYGSFQNGSMGGVVKVNNSRASRLMGALLGSAKHDASRMGEMCLPPSLVPRPITSSINPMTFCLFSPGTGGCISNDHPRPLAQRQALLQALNRHFSTTIVLAFVP